MHACLIIGAFRSGSSFAWVSQANYSEKIDELESFCKESYFYAFSKKNKIKKYQIKSLLEICHQNYETLLSLSPIAAEVSSDCLLEWSSLISSVRILSQEYEKVLSRTDDQNFPEWPSCEAIAMHIQSLINSTLIVSKREKLTSQCSDN